MLLLLLLLQAWLQCEGPATPMTHRRSTDLSPTHRFLVLPRDAMHSADYAVARCLSVRPSIRHTPPLSRND